MTIDLLFGVHAHQPVGNFPEVIATAHLRCYRMFLRTLERYPEFRFSAHFSGWLLEELAQRWPEDMERLAAMTRRGQIEWFGSGDCEPVLAAIPQRDRVTQLTALSDRIERMFGTRPRGAWLTERVWESSVVPALADCGLRYVAVDDYHFLCTGQEEARLDSFWSTEEDGRGLDLFPISEQARYRLPFSEADQAVAWIEDQARLGRRAAIYFDDIEKFGIWPETYAWVYEKGWLERFIEGVLRSDLIRTRTFAEHHAAHATRGVIYLPTASYIEMNEWTLPAAAARGYHRLVESERTAGRYESNKAWMRGGIWRNFLSRYPESNWMHKRMLAVSARFAALSAGQRTPEMLEYLHRAQANDAYWHGLFGGLYLPHLRRAVWHNLLALEAALDAVAPPPAIETKDVDLDGREETLLRGQGLLAAIRGDADAALCEFSSLRAAHNFADSLRRIDEAYHDRIGAADRTEARHEGIASAHDRVAFVHAIVPGDIVPDPRPRGLFLDTLIRGDGTRVEPGYAMLSATPGRFAASQSGWQVVKEYALAADGLTVRYRFDGDVAAFTTQLNISMPSCDGYSGRYILADGRMPCGFGQELRQPALERIVLDDSVLGGALEIRCDPPAEFAARPHHTVSQSEAGFEKIMQAAELNLTWRSDGGPRELTVRLSFRGVESDPPPR